MPEQKQITFTINDQKVTTAPGTLVIEAAKHQGIEVPSFCYYPGLALQAACRMCLVEVEKDAEASNRLHAASPKAW